MLPDLERPRFGNSPRCRRPFPFDLRFAHLLDGNGEPACAEERLTSHQLVARACRGPVRLLLSHELKGEPKRRQRLRRCFFGATCFMAFLSFFFAAMPAGYRKPLTAAHPNQKVLKPNAALLACCGLHSWNEVVMATEITKGIKAKSPAEAAKQVEKLAARLPASEVREPRTPIKTLTAEARRMQGRVDKDARALAAKSAYSSSDGLLLDALITAFVTTSDATFASTAPNLPNKLARQRDEAEALLTEVWSDLSYLAEETDDADLARKVDTLREGDSLDDTVADLALTFPLLKARAKPLAAVGTADAKATAARLEKLHGLLAEEQSDTTGDDYDALKDSRDRLGVVLEAHLARLRRHGKKAFRNEPKKASQYVDAYRSSAPSKREEPEA